MIQEFNLDLEQTNQFIKCFIAAMKSPESPILLSNHSEKFENGYFLSQHDVTFKVDDDDFFVQWLIKFNFDNTLCSISNLNNVGNLDFELKLSKFLNSVLQNVLSLKRKEYFKRVVYRTISGTNFMGEYWLSGIRFAQLIPDDNECHLYDAERLLVFDQKVLAIDNSNANEIALEKASEMSAYLSFIMNIGLEKPKKEERFFMKSDKNTFSMNRASTQVITSEYEFNKMPKKGKVSELGVYKGSIFDRFPQLGTLLCPEETRNILRNIKDAKEEYKDAFKRCCMLYQLALNIGKCYPTVRISYTCAAVEAIVKTNPKEYNSFSSFMDKYSGENKNLHNFIYQSVRSAHFHSGKFVLGEFNFGSTMMNPIASEISDMELNAEVKMRFAIINWLNEKINFKEKRDHNFKEIETKRFGISGRTTI